MVIAVYLTRSLSSINESEKRISLNFINAKLQLLILKLWILGFAPF